MTTRTTDDLSTLEAEIQRTRERLAGTIDELVDRASPKNIVGRQMGAARARFVDTETGAPRTDAILKVAGGVLAAVVVLAVIRKIVK